MSGPNSGWFSDRSVCYLAAGRPVVTMRTGFSRFYPVGEGLFEYTDRPRRIAAHRRDQRATIAGTAEAARDGRGGIFRQRSRCFGDNGGRPALTSRPS